MASERRRRGHELGDPRRGRGRYPREVEGTRADSLLMGASPGPDGRDEPGRGVAEARQVLGEAPEGGWAVRRRAPGVPQRRIRRRDARPMLAPRGRGQRTKSSAARSDVVTRAPGGSRQVGRRARVRGCHLGARRVGRVQVRRRRRFARLRGGSGPARGEAGCRAPCEGRIHDSERRGRRRTHAKQGVVRERGRRAAGVPEGGRAMDGA
mmetsp:Transcript_14189/g.61774  ORF Transcript_14189/g.61774 Transcript_14189/m.61774 type:complete len:209 (+) Transcript_14189:547-1173(+)